MLVAGRVAGVDAQVLAQTRNGVESDGSAAASEAGSMANVSATSGRRHRLRIMARV